MYIKYPKTMHLPFSPGISKDDRVLKSTEHFHNKEVVVELKLDGECSSFYRDHIHARSLDSRHHVSRSWIKNLHSKICQDIPNNWRICGENMWAKHSIYYDNLTSFFYVFSIWNEHNICLSIDETLEWCKLLELEHVPIIFRGIYKSEIIENLYNPVYDGCENEGFVVRLAESFKFEDFEKSVAKYVRANHVQTQNFWGSVVTPNKLRLDISKK